jgi:hypothetical protein
MVIGVSAIGVLLFLALCVSRVKAYRGSKKNVQTLFYTK